jgi:hypothetical protein
MPVEKKWQPETFLEGENKFIAAHEKAEKFRQSKRHDEIFSCTATVAVFEAILGLLNASIFAFLNLLLCLTPIGADEQMVIKDSDAIRNVGRHVEVCGLAAPSRSVHSVPPTSISDENIPTSRLPGSLPIQELRLTRSQNYKGKTSASSVRLNFARGNRRLKSCRCTKL